MKGQTEVGAKYTKFNNDIIDQGQNHQDQQILISQICFFFFDDFELDHLLRRKDPLIQFESTDETHPQPIMLPLMFQVPL